jgi:hypothetical protein
MNHQTPTSEIARRWLVKNRAIAMMLRLFEFAETGPYKNVGTGVEPFKVVASFSSLCNLCVLCASVVVVFQIPITTEAQRTQRLHREKPPRDFGRKAASHCSYKNVA